MRRLLYLPDGQVFDVELRPETDHVSALAYPHRPSGGFEGEPIAEIDGATFDEAEKTLYRLLLDRYYA